MKKNPLLFYETIRLPSLMQQPDKENRLRKVLLFLWFCQMMRLEIFIFFCMNRFVPF